MKANVSSNAIVLESGHLLGTLFIWSDSAVLNYCKKHNAETVDYDDKYDKMEVDRIVDKAKEICEEKNVNLNTY